MPQSLSKIYVHVIFSTIERADMLPKIHLGEIHKFLAGIMKNLGCVPIIVGGTSNHVHILCAMSNTITVSDMVRQTKSVSSKWIKEHYSNMRSFAWQGGYAAFSVSQSNVEAVINYIANQEQHHGKRSFKDELIGFLKKYNVQYDERYI